MIMRDWLAAMFPRQNDRRTGKRRNGWQSGTGYLVGTELLEQRQLLTANLDFAFNIGGTGEDKAQSVIIDDSGNTYLAGGFQGTVDFDPGVGVTELTSAGSFKDLFLAKYNSTGDLQWVGSIKNGVANHSPGLAFTPTGDIVVTGPFSGVTDFDFGDGESTLDAGFSKDAFVAKYDSNGGLIWAKQFGGTSGLDAGPLTVDEAGNIYSAGVMSVGDADFDPGAGTFTLTTAEANGLGYLSKLDSSGNFVWSKSLVDDVNADGRAEFLDLKVDGDQNVFGTGLFFGTIDFDPGTGTTTRSSSADFNFDGFLLKLTSVGDLSYINTLGGASGFEQIAGLAIDGAGNAYVTGQIEGSADYVSSSGTLNFNSAGINDIFVGKVNSSGALAWGRTYGSTGADSGNDIAINGNSNLYVVGFFSETVDFDAGEGTSNLISDETGDAFLLNLDTDGGFSWVAGFPGDGTGSGDSVTVNSSAEIVLSGYFDESFDADPGAGTTTLSSGGSLDGFVIKLTDIAPAMNTAPVLDNSGDPTLETLEEDEIAVNIIGSTITEIIAAMAPGGITDPDFEAVPGIAVIGANQLSGTWQFSLDGGTNWTDFGATSSSTALLLADDSTTRVRYVPNPNTNGTVGFTFVAWDQTTGTNGTKMEALIQNRGGSSAFSIEKEHVFITVTPVNDAPVLTRNIKVSLPSIEPLAPADDGVLLKDLIASAPVDLIRDVDKDALEGIAVIGANQLNGTWEYSTDNGANWNGFGSTDPGAALLLAANDQTRVRYVSTTNRVGEVGFSYIAWDQTSGNNGETADVTSERGGTWAFSNAKGIVTIDVSGSNTAPMLNPEGEPTLDGIATDITDENNVGTLISDLIARMSPEGGISDPDANAKQGIAIIGANQLSGTWQFTINGGANWTNFGTTSNVNALLLADDANTRVRFQPNPGFTGTPGLRFIAWDQTTGVNGTFAAATIRGGLSAFSVKKEIATIAVTV